MGEKKLVLVDLRVGILGAFPDSLDFSDILHHLLQFYQRYKKKEMRDVLMLKSYTLILQELHRERFFFFTVNSN